MANYTSGSLNSPSLEIGIALVLQDRFSNQAREASGHIRKLHNDAQMAVNANLITARSISESVINGSQKALQVLSDTVVSGAGFVDTMTTVGAITNATNAQIETLSNTAQTLGMKTMFASRDIASGMQYLAMAGNSAQDINKMIEGAAMVANATGMELGGKGGAADMITNVMKTFRVESAEAAVVIGDQLTKAALSSNMSMYDLAESLKYASSDMVTLKKQLPEVAALVGTLGNAGIQGSMAGTALSNMARYFGRSISDPNFKGFKQLENLGINRSDLVDASGNLLDFGIVLGKVRDAMQGINAIDQLKIVNAIFGTRGQRAGVAIMRDLEGYQSLLNKIQNESAGYTASIVEKRMNSIAGAIDQMVSAWENVKTTFTEAIAPILTPILRTAGSILEILRGIFDIPLLGNFIATLMGVIPVVTLIGGGLVRLKSSWMLLFGNSQVTASNMFSILMGGWRGASLAALDYQKIERAIIAQRGAGIRGNTGRAILGSGALGGYTYDWETNRYRDMVTGKYISKKEALSRNRAMSPKSRTSEGLVAALMGSNVVRGAKIGFARGGLFGGITKSLGIVAKGALGMMGGPWGLAIMAISAFLPRIMDAIKGNKESQDENTKAVNVLNSYNRKKDAETKDPSLPLDQKLTALVNSLYYWAGEISKSKPTVINVTTPDGIKKTFEILEGQSQDINLATGTK